MPIEDALKAEAPIISNAMLIGDKLKFLSMLLTLKVIRPSVVIDASVYRQGLMYLLCLYFQCVIDDNGDPTDVLSPEALDVCKHNNVTATKVSEITGNKEPAIYKAIQEAVERVNAKATSSAQKVQKWVILERDFSISGGELGKWLTDTDRYREEGSIIFN